MKIGKLIGYNLTTKRMDDNSLFIDVPIKLFSDTIDDVNYEDISSIVNWNTYGLNLNCLSDDIRSEIKTLMTTAGGFSSLTSEEKSIASSWFVVDKSSRDTIHTTTQQENFAKELSKKLDNDRYIKESNIKYISIKDSDGFNLNNGVFILPNTSSEFNYKIIGSSISSDRVLNIPLLTSDDVLVTASFSQVLTNKTLNSTNNTITSTSQAVGDILKNNGSKYVRMGKGSPLQVLRVNTGGTDLEYASLPISSESTQGLIEIATQTETNTGVDDLRTITPLKLKNWNHLKVDTVYAYNLAATNGTFNSLVCTSAGAASYLSRWYFRSFSNASNNVAFFNRILPNTYVSGTNIKLNIHWTNSTTTGNVRWHIGMTQPGTNDTFGDSSETEWIVSNISTPSSSGFSRKISSFTFNGSSLVPGDDISIIMVREGGAAGDTNSGVSYINTVSVEIQIIG